jgi:alpha-tubulin suppressor-like RCC1 family protein
MSMRFKGGVISATPPTTLSGVWTLQQQMQKLAAGYWSGVYQLWAWGSGSQSELGLGNNKAYSSPKQVGSPTNWNFVGATKEGSFAIKKDNSLWSWGNGQYGQLGNGLAGGTNFSTPVQTGSLTNWLQISGGLFSVLAVKTDGTLWSWGRNEYGQLGLNNAGAGDATARSSPVQVGALTGWATTSAGSYHSVSIKTDGTLWSWGRNNQGQLGLGNNTTYSSPKQVGGLTSWSKVACANESTAAIKTDGTLWSWGRGYGGQLGINNTFNYNSPKQVGALTDWSKISAGFRNFVAVKTDGTLWCWGFGGRGELGQNNTTTSSSPVQVGALTTWYEPGSGNSSFFCIKTDGTLWAWGYNGSGRLGLGNTANRSSPVQIGTATTWTTIVKSGTSYHTHAIKTP